MRGANTGMENEINSDHEAAKAARKAARSAAEPGLRRNLDRPRIVEAIKATEPPKLGITMRKVVDYVHMHPGSSQKDISIAVNPKNIATYGRISLLRAIKAGYVRAERHGRSYAHYLTSQGESIYIDRK